MFYYGLGNGAEKSDKVRKFKKNFKYLLYLGKIPELNSNQTISEFPDIEVKANNTCLEEEDGSVEEVVQCLDELKDKFGNFLLNAIKQEDLLGLTMSLK